MQQQRQEQQHRGLCMESGLAGAVKLRIKATIPHLLHLKHRKLSRFLDVSLQPVVSTTRMDTWPTMQAQYQLLDRRRHILGQKVTLSEYVHREHGHLQFVLRPKQCEGMDIACNASKQ
eukprot:TRINITY_DN12055_c0_g1_i12.p6 TRINITY_DN12055_c0_g1~~TRINITY_DN12055_c0_g1_i12.p6  ORF type:complete len:118 (+),score=15.26 TRINITY_DN12055_c0_g1_i12:3325-3678(+)